MINVSIYVLLLMLEKMPERTLSNRPEAHTLHPQEINVSIHIIRIYLQSKKYN